MTGPVWIATPGGGAYCASPPQRGTLTCTVCANVPAPPGKHCKLCGRADAPERKLK